MQFSCSLQASTLQGVSSATKQHHALHVLTGGFCSLAALIDGQIFCVHGGLSPTINTIDQVFAELCMEPNSLWLCVWSPCDACWSV